MIHSNSIHVTGVFVVTPSRWISTITFFTIIIMIQMIQILHMQILKNNNLQTITFKQLSNNQDLVQDLLMKSNNHQIFKHWIKLSKKIPAHIITTT